MSFRTISVRLTGNANSLNSALYQSSRAVSDFGRGIQRNVSGSLLKFGVGATAAGTAAIALGTALYKSVGAAVQFDAAMRNVNSISGLSERQLRSLSGQVLDLSTRVPQSATNLANGLYQIASSGFQGAQGLNILKASAIAATAGITDTATSAQVIVGALNAYGLGADQATKVSDELFQTVNLGVLNFNDLAQGLGDVVGTAAAAKVPLNDVGAAIATMTRAGVVPAEAFTSLNRVLQAILQPSDALALVFKQLGYQSGAAALQSKGLQGVIEDIRRVTGGTSTSILTLFDDIRGARGALALMSNQGRLYTEVAKGFNDQTEIQGRTLKTFQEQMKSVSAQWQLFKNRIGAASIEVATKLLPAILDLLRSIEKLGHEAIPAITGGLRDLHPFFEGLRRVGADVVTVLKAMISVATPVAKALASIAGAAIIGTLNGLAAALAAVVDFVTRFRIVLDAAAVVLLTRMMPALSVAAWKALSTVIVGVTDVIFGFAGGVEKGIQSLGGLRQGFSRIISPATLMSAALVGGVELLNQFRQSAADAKQAAQQMAQGFDILHPESAASQDALANLNATLASTERNLNKGGIAGQAFVGVLQDITPFTANTTTNLTNLNKKANELYDTLIKQSTAATSAVNDVALSLNIPLLQNENGPVGQLAVLTDLAAKLNLGPALAAGGRVGEEAMARLKQAYVDLGAQGQATAGAIAQAADFDLEKMQALTDAIQKAGDAASKAFLGATDVISNFDPTQAAADVKSAQEAVANAQNDVRDATEKLHDAQSKQTKSASAAVAKSHEVRDASQRLAEADKKAADARTSLADAQKKANLPAYYRSTIAEANKFADNIETAMRRGLDPQFVQRLLQAGPAQAGPLLDKIVSDHSGRMIKLVNDSEAALQRINVKVIRFAQLTAQATSPNLAPGVAQRMATELSDAMREAEAVLEHPNFTVEQVAKALGIDVGRARQIGTDFGITFAAASNAAIAAHPVTVTTPDGRIHVTGSKTYGAAGGGYLTGPGTPTSDSILARVSTGEYVQRAKAVAYYGVDFMHALNSLRIPRFAGGGSVGTSVGVGRQVRTVIVHVDSGPRSITNSRPVQIGQVVAHDYDDFRRQLDRDARVNAVMGLRGGG